MALDPRISLGVQPVQLSNPLDQYSKIAALQQAQNQNALAQYQLSAAQREEEKTNALSRAYQEAYNPKSGEIDANKLRMSLATGGFGAQLPAVEKSLGELETQRLTRQKTEGELVKQRMEQSRELLATVRTPEEYLEWHNANHADPVLGKYLADRGITADKSRAQIGAQLQQPGGFETLLRNSALGLEKSMKQHFVDQNLGGTRQVLSLPEYQVPGAPSKATVVPGSVANVTMTPAELAADARARQRLAFDIGQAAPAAVEAKAAAQERGRASVEGAGKPVFKDGQWIVPPTDMRAGEVREVVSPTATKDAKEALNLIEQASKLIPKATGSYLGNLLDTAAQAVGVGTGGAQATAQLQALEGILVSKMPKMSGPQSDKDVALYRQMAGNIGNPNVPPSIKQEALKTIKEIQERYAGVPKAGGGAFTQQQPASKPPAGIDAALWNVMTPQERALWQK